MMVQAQPIVDTDQLYALLSLNNHALLLPQGDIRTLESILDMSSGDQLANSVGWLPFEGDHWPVYGLDAGLNPCPELPEAQRLCVLLSIESGYFGLLCQNSATLPGSAVRIRPLPTAMIKPGSPLRGLALYGDRVGLVSTAEALAIFLGVGVGLLSP
jgi:hypothetical protein